MDRKVRIGCDIFLAGLLILFLAASVNLKMSEIKLKIEYGEMNDGINGGVAQLFYSENQEEFCEEKSQRENIADGYVIFQLPEVELSKIQLRFDPVMSEDDFVIHKVVVLLGNRSILSWSGEELMNYIEYTINCESERMEGSFLHRMIQLFA